MGRIGRLGKNEIDKGRGRIMMRGIKVRKENGVRNERKR
jgi:hypothetical protein